MSPCFSTLVPKNAIFSHFSLQRLVLGLFCCLKILPFVFSNTLRHIQALRSCLLLLEVLVYRFDQLYVDFSSLWLLKGAHPRLRELFLHSTSTRSTFTSLKQPNLHPFCLLPKSIMPLLAFYIHPDLRFLIMKSLIIFLVIRILFLPLLLHHLYP